MTDTQSLEVAKNAIAVYGSLQVECKAVGVNAPPLSELHAMTGTDLLAFMSANGLRFVRNGTPCVRNIPDEDGGL